MPGHRKAYLTIDDSPSPRFRELVDFLSARNVQALFFCRGDLLEADQDAGVYAVREGHILGNHGYAHNRASAMSFAEVCADISRAEAVVEHVYAGAGVRRPGKYFRFPYMDRGMGPWLCDPAQLPAEHRAAQEDLLRAGLGHEPVTPDEQQIEETRRLQDFLRAQGYAPLPVQGVTLPWYAETEMAQSIDALCTFSTSDWAVTGRHKGRHGYDNVDDLKQKIDTDPWLQDETSAHILLAHDQEEIHATTTALIAHVLARGFELLDFCTDNR